MQLIAGSVQHLIREKKDISLVFVGLPMGVMDLINGKALTFLRRAQSEELDFISLIEVRLFVQGRVRRLGVDPQGRAARDDGTGDSGLCVSDSS